MFHGRISLNLVLLLLLVNFVSGFRLRLMYILLIVSTKSNLTHLHGFQQLVLLPYFIEITWFHLYQQNKSSESKVKLRQTSNRCKRVLEAAKFAYATKTNLALGTFGKLLIVFSTKVKLLYLLYSTDWKCCLLHLIKQNYLLKTIILMTLVSLYLFPF